eukprot:1878206-Alexandrium_andersonii.AAC.1
MSASLVGSEMCIRDSPGEAPRRPPLGLPPLRRRLRWRLPRLPSPQPVSYTHLRLPTICSV